MSECGGALRLDHGRRVAAAKGINGPLFRLASVTAQRKEDLARCWAGRRLNCRVRSRPGATVSGSQGASWGRSRHWAATVPGAGGRRRGRSQCHAAPGESLTTAFTLPRRLRLRGRGSPARASMRERLPSKEQHDYCLTEAQRAKSLTEGGNEPIDRGASLGAACKGSYFEASASLNW